MGFVWPIVEQSSEEAATRKQSTEVEDFDASRSQADSSVNKRSGSLAPVGSKKQQNLIPLFNAMHTTAAHSKMTFAQRASDSVPPTEGTPAIAGRLLSTPAPTRDGTPKLMSSPDVAMKTTMAAPKKKKKSMHCCNINSCVNIELICVCQGCQMPLQQLGNSITTLRNPDFYREE